MAVAVELFVSIHMSVFVLFPLASILKPDNIRETFLDMFFLRLIVLFTIDLFFTEIAIVDFLAVFFGAFILVPLTSAVKGKTSLGIKVKERDNSNKFLNKEYTWKEIKKEEPDIIVPKAKFNKQESNSVIRYR